MLCIFVRTCCGAAALDKEQRKKMTNRAVILAAVREVERWPGGQVRARSANIGLVVLIQDVIYINK